MRDRLEDLCHRLRWIDASKPANGLQELYNAGLAGHIRIAIA